MSLYFAAGSPTADLSHADLRAALSEVFAKLGPRQRVLALPPDFTRANSMAGPLTCMTYEHYRRRLTDVMPALGTHVPMPDWQLDRMFPSVPKSLFRAHDWRNDVVTIGARAGRVRARGDRGDLEQALAGPAQPARLAGRARSDPLDRPGRAARSDRHGQLQ